MSPTSACVAPTTPAYGAMIVLNDCVATACPALALTAASCACAALYSASDWSTAAWLTNFCARRSRLRSCLRLALARFASASATCEKLAATAWSAARASIRANTWPARTVSPALTLSSTMRPATCAPSVACFTASTTPSAVIVCGRSRTATVRNATWRGPATDCAAAISGPTKNATAARATTPARSTARIRILVERRSILARATGADAERQVRRAPAEQAGAQRNEAEKAPPAGIALTERHPGEQRNADDDAHATIDTANVLLHDDLTIQGKKDER